MRVKNGSRWECDEGMVHIRTSSVCDADLNTVCGHASYREGKTTNRKVNCSTCISIAKSIINECTIEQPKVKKENPKTARLRAARKARRDEMLGDYGGGRD